MFSPFYWCLGPLHMSPATGLLGYWDECCCLFTWECQSRNKTKMVEHKLVSFATIVRLCRLFQLYYYLRSGKTYQVKNHAISATVVGIAKLFCQKMIRPGHPGWIQSYGKIFIPNTEISVANSEISVTEAARLLIWRNWIFFLRKERRGDISEIEPAQSTGLTWRGPLLQTPVRVRVAKAVKISAIMIKARLESFSC